MTSDIATISNIVTFSSAPSTVFCVFGLDIVIDCFIVTNFSLQIWCRYTQSPLYTKYLTT